jgi:hypothetical protein
MKDKHFIDLLQLGYRAEVKPVLGRWYIHNNIQIKLKIKYANEDNCGISSYYNKNNENNDNNDNDNNKNNNRNNDNILQIKQNNEFIQEKELEEVYVYMMGLESTPNNSHIKR